MLVGMASDELKKSPKRALPRSRSRTISSVHRSPRRSRVHATGQLDRRSGFLFLRDPALDRGVVFSVISLAFYKGLAVQARAKTDFRGRLSQTTPFSVKPLIASAL